MRTFRSSKGPNSKVSSERWDGGGRPSLQLATCILLDSPRERNSPSRLQTHPLSGASRSITETTRVTAARGTGVTACGGAKPDDPGEEAGWCRLLDPLPLLPRRKMPLRELQSSLLSV